MIYKATNDTETYYNVYYFVTSPTKTADSNPSCKWAASQKVTLAVERLCVRCTSA